MLSNAQETVFRPDQAYEIHQGHRRQLVELAAKIAKIYDDLGAETRARAVEQVRSRLESDRFKVMVLGEFKRGKSTVVNALLGDEVLPRRVVPCTAVISEIKWAESKRAILHFRHPLPPQLPEKLPAEIVSHIRRAGGGPVPSLEVPVDRLLAYVAIPEPEKEQMESVAESPYERVELFWPLDLCRNGVEIIDSPGLNEHESRTRVTANYLQQVDAILFTMLCQPLGSKNELDFIDHDLVGAGHEYLFFICNRFDDVPPREREEVRQYAISKLRPRTRLEEDGIFFLSARQALEGRMDGDRRTEEASGILLLERALTRFLTQDKGRVKLLQPARELAAALGEIERRILPAQKVMLDESLVELTEKYEKAKPMLRDAERRKEQIIHGLENHRTSLELRVRSDVEQYLRQLITQIPDWVEGLVLDKKIKILTTSPREQIKDLIGEIVDKVRSRMEREVQSWSQESLVPVIEDWRKRVEEEMGRRIDGFFEQIQQIDKVFASLEAPPSDQVGEGSEGKRLIAAWIGFIFNPAIGFQALNVGFKYLVTSLIVQITTGIFLSLLGLSNPIALVGALLAGLLASKIVLGKFTSEVKKRVAAKLQEQFREKLHEIVEGIAVQIKEQAQTATDHVETSLDGEIQGIREKVEAVLKDKRAGEFKVQARRRMLKELEETIAEADTSLKQVVFAVAEG